LPLQQKQCGREGSQTSVGTVQGSLISPHEFKKEKEKKTQ